jgi:hypothetical protein
MFKIIMAMIILACAYSQKKKETLVTSINYTNVSFDNWSKGGEDAFSWQGTLSYESVYQFGQYTLKNSAKLAYGQTRIADGGIKKTADEINIESVLNMKLQKHFNPYLAVQFQTEFLTGYRYDPKGNEEVSKFMDPGYFYQSLGYGYKNDSSTFTVRAGFSLKETFTSKFTSFTNDPATPEIETVRVETGFKLDSEFSDYVSEKILFTAKTAIFSTMKSIRTTDVKLDLSLASQVSDIINVNFNFLMLYDTDLKANGSNPFKRQIKNFLSVGLTYNFL